LSLPATLAISFALLLVGVEARAQPSPARARRERTVTITGNPADPPHEIRVARGVATVLVFKSRINGHAIEADKTRVKILEAGVWAILFELVIDLGRDERLVLGVPFSDGQQAVFVLVSSPSEVDTRINVVRREQTIESCQAELAETQARCSKFSPARIARAGLLTPKGVIAHDIKECSGETWMVNGLRCAEGTAYRAETWGLVALMISNDSDQPMWVPQEATLKGMKTGALVKGTVEMEPAQIGPGEAEWVFVEIEPPNARESFVLELRDAAGRGITIPNVLLAGPENKKEKR
jgi:uncharacterized protein (TIGR02268 family)